MEKQLYCDEELDDDPGVPPNSPDVSDEMGETSLIGRLYYVNDIKGSIGNDARVYYEPDDWIRIEDEEWRIEFSTWFEDYEFNYVSQCDESTGIITHEKIKFEAQVIANCRIKDTTQSVIFTITPKETDPVLENFKVLIELKNE